ncbi:unnamed protein product [Porites evermanni]|uniref:Uncharacterized protein n=1 Tax=Porites evermanni TaxID=104178 RepID=A0ABN8M9T7_9CNID|nr:unnamed protein product [Porites evermanni]
MSGHEVYEASQNDYIEVVNIGEDNSDSEVTIFYRPNKGFKIVNAYLVSEKQRTRHGRDYTMLNIVSSKANRFVVRRYDDGEYYLENDDGFWMTEDQVNLN